MGSLLSLPIDELIPELVASLRGAPNVVLEAAPGAGKTTRVPPAVLGLVAGEVLVLEPRRIAARLAARRVAAEMGEAVGETVGYQVRFEAVEGPKTRLRFVTEGILTRRMISDPMLKGVDSVILDEFHERHLDSDMALALLRRLQSKRPELKLVVMSATLDAGPIAEFLGGCAVLSSAGRVFPLTVRHLPYSPEPLPVQVRKAVEGLPLKGHTLVFLPGLAEIRRTMRECEAVAQRNNLLVLPLHGDLTPAEQDLAVGPSDRRKLILATNVAESSITVDGVDTVIDSGMARVATYSPWTGLPTLQIGRVSKASARQRAGRAGRTGPGTVVRLYPEEDFAHRPEHDTPEILRSDLSQLCLALRVMGVAHFRDVAWLDAPPDAAIETAESLLDLLGATGAKAVELARYPLPPRLARILVEAMKRGVGEDGCVAATLLSLGSRGEKTDLLEAMEEAVSAKGDPRMQQHVAQLRRVARPAKQTAHDDDALLQAVLAGFPDRVGRKRSEKQVLMANGISADFAGAAPAYEFLVAVDAEDRKEKPLPVVRMTARIEPEWLIDLFPERIRETNTVSWHRTGERVEAVSSLLYDELVLQETRGALPEPEAAAALLAEKAMERGIERFVDTEALQNLLARIAFAGLTTPDVAAALRALCTGLRSFADLKAAGPALLGLLESQAGARELAELAPTHLKMKAGRPMLVHYDERNPPWISSRLQDFIGMKETPRIGPERTPVVVHLLAPNQRAVQTTTDLAGFWARLYPTIRPGLQRRYPKHQWPEKV